MADQPAYRPMAASDFFPDHRSARPLEPGTVARGQRREDIAWWTGRRQDPRLEGDAVSFTPQSFVDQVPVALTLEFLERGKDCFTTYCSVCHDRLGTGNGKIVQRGFTKPPSLLDDLSRGFQLRGIKQPLRTVPVGYIFEVVSNGYGAMPDYSSQVPIPDRWAVVAYVRALQISQRPSTGELKHLPPDQQELLPPVEKKP